MSIADTQNDVELLFDVAANNPLSESDKDLAEYLEFTYVKDNENGHQLVIYNTATETETILKEVK